VAENKGVLHRYAAALEAIAAAKGGLTLTELMHATGLPRGTVHRLIGALVEVGFIEPSNGRKVYVLGRRMLSMLHLGTPAQVIGRLVVPVLEKLVEQYQETAFLAGLANGEVRSVAMAVPTHEVHSHVEPGRVMPIHAAASAKAIFAFQDDAVIAAALNGRPGRFTDNARVDKAEIRAELAGVRESGFAVCNEELDPGIFSYACPVRFADVGVIYSVGLVGPTKRVRRHEEAEVVAALRLSATRIATLLTGQ